MLELVFNVCGGVSYVIITFIDLSRFRAVSPHLSVCLVIKKFEAIDSCNNMNLEKSLKTLNSSVY